MKVLYIGLLPPRLGGRLYTGAAEHGWQLAQNARANGHEVYFLANTSISSCRSKEGISIIPMPASKLGKAIYGGYGYIKLNRLFSRHLRHFNTKEKIAIFSSSVFLNKLVSIIRPHLIHVQGESYWPLCTRAFSFCLPVIISTHGGLKSLKDRKHLKKFKTIFKQAQALIFVTKFWSEPEKAVVDEFQGKIHIINNPVDPARIPLIDKKRAREETGISDKKIVFFSGICRSIEIKRLDILLRAFSENDFLKKKYHLIAIADEDGHKLAHKYVKNNNIQASLYLAPSWEKIVTFYNAADVFVLPSQTEAFSLVLSESLLAGVPLVGYSNVLQELEDILGIEVGEKFDASRDTSLDLGQKIIKVANQQYDRKFIREKMIEKLSWERKFKDFESVYQSLLYPDM